VDLMSIYMVIRDFCLSNGGREVHRSWRDKMLSQGRDVAKERMDWDTLPEDDKELDQTIARDVITDFIAFIQSHPHG
jgi:hypothetical protein